jgi:hypothetical protein
MVEWPESTPDQQGAHPGFYNDDHMWATWVVDVMGKPKLVRLLEQIGAGVLLHHNTTDLPIEEVGWAKPEEYQAAANTLQNLLAAKDLIIKPLVEIYRTEWDRLIGDGTDETAEEWFARDLNDVAAIASYARDQGAKTMTLGYYW